MEKSKIIVATFSAPEELHNKFINHCDAYGLNRSAILRKLVTKYLEEKEVLKKDVHEFDELY
ncbi:hypothetical protein KW850_31365 [Bacillus sp. sid0103]|uniref:hypothetical protein n=1 Tax=Bacillus sp. sid0103 TaxID=2856337 RepID=UPI001C454BD9|nr:hypothetical protein [Bacillus sp. sid0103]MBV7509622.1 hypothetical protein [Bacillus sp. sid0103]